MFTFGMSKAVQIKEGNIKIIICGFRDVIVYTISLIIYRVGIFSLKLNF